MSDREQHPLYTWPMPIGKYKATFLSDVPLEYLRNLVKDKNSVVNYPEIKEWVDYVGRTELAAAFQARLEGGRFAKLICSKVTYATEAIAKADLSRIKSRDQKHKKPYRAYECPDCGGFHLTSKEDINWLKKQKP